MPWDPFKGLPNRIAPDDTPVHEPLNQRIPETLRFVP